MYCGWLEGAVSTHYSIYRPLYCDGGFGHEHTSYSDVIPTDQTVSQMDAAIGDEVYRSTCEPTQRWHKISATYPVYGCGNALRDQANIDYGNRYTFQPQEPNPQIFIDYYLPAFWWGLYVVHWHVWNNDPANVTDQIPRHIPLPL